MNLSPFSGEQIVQVANPDPFARPTMRSPVLHTPVWMIAAAQALRLLWRVAKFLARHPFLDAGVAVMVLAWHTLGWPGPAAITATLIVTAITWRLFWPVSWTRFVAIPARGRYRRWHYRRQWLAVMTISYLAVPYRLCPPGVRPVRG